MSKSTEETLSPNGCKIPGCTFKLKVSRGKPYLTNGYCNTHHLRVARGLDPTIPTGWDSRQAIIEGDIAKIPLGINAKNGYVVVDKDFAWLDKYHWRSNVIAGGYAVARVNGKDTRMHRLVIEQKEGLITDHINGDRLDNRKANLRLVTSQQNAMNSAPKRGARYKGVYRSGNRWQVAIKVDGKKLNGGFYATPEEAAEAYNSLARKHQGEYARLNVITLNNQSKESRDE